MPTGMRISLISADHSSVYLIHAQAITHGGDKKVGTAKNTSGLCRSKLGLDEALA